MEPTIETPVDKQAVYAVQPEATQRKKQAPIFAVEVMNGIVFAVILILFGLVWGNFASLTFAAV